MELFLLSLYRWPLINSLGNFKTTFSFMIITSSIETFISLLISEMKFWTNSSGAEAPEDNPIIFTIFNFSIGALLP